ncbi:RNA polymerase III RPC4-domain-containing protein [Chytriomyces cf. hyalinus JEL632]|nr:RNA polymerase III RPC4-domain-containing protein [Chytriomyces cf. hyalinus JEL632]
MGSRGGFGSGGGESEREVKPEPMMGFAEDSMLEGKLDERDLVMMADSFAVGDEDAPVSLGWSRRIKDREHFLAGKAAAKAKTDSMALDGEGEKEMQTFNEFVQPEQKQLFFFQLPKNLPYFDGIETSLAGGSIQTRDATADTDMTPKAEGVIGKILVHRSGRMKLVLGSITLDVDVVPYSDCVQEAVAIDSAAKTSCILGRVSKRFICTPDINDLLH